PLQQSVYPPYSPFYSRPLAALLGVFARFEGFGAFLAPNPEGRRAPGTLPIRGSLATTSSHARSTASSKSGASAGRTCQPVTSFPSTCMDRIFGKLASQTFVILLGSG